MRLADRCQRGSLVPSGADALPPVADWYAVTDFDTEYYADPKVYPTMGDHPRLFFHQDDVEAIRQKFQDPFNADVARALCETAAINFDGVWNVENTNNYNGTDLGIIECKAFYYAIFKNDPNPETRERAIKYGKQAIVAIKNCQQTFTYTGNALRARGHVMYVTALVYDWCYDLLTQKDKARLASGGQLIANGMEIGFPPIGQEVVNGHGAEKQLLRDWLAFSIAIYDEFPTVYELVGGRFFEEYVPARNKYWATAQYHYQGTKYGAYRSVADIMGQLLIHRMADVDYADDPNFVYDEGFSKLAYQWMYSRRPDERYMRDGDGGAIYTILDRYGLLYYAAMLYKDPVLYEEFLSIPEAMTTYSYMENLTLAMILCLQDPSVENMEAGALPYTHYHSSPYGMLVARTGLEYNNRSSNDVIVNMKIQESYVGGHQNREAGSFQIYYKGILTGDSGFYGNFGVDHDRYYQTQSISKNTVAITSAANPKGWQTSAENTKNPGNSGTVLGVEYGNNIYRPEYSYISGDVAKSYDRNVLEAVRSMLFLNLNLDGYTTYTCACGDTYKGNEVAATGHSYTYTENGDNHIVGCKNCDLNETAGHKYEDGKCVCGAYEEPEVHEHVWDEGVVLAAPTYYATGKIRYTCSCKETKTEVLPALFYGTAVNLGNALDLTFYFYDTFADGNGKAVFVRERADGTTETTEALLSTFEKAGSFYKIVYPGVAAKEMSDNVHLTIYDANGNVVSETKTDSIRAYAMRMLRNENYANDAKLKTMLVDMLNYGAVAQAAFNNYGINDLANKLLTEEEKALATPTVQAYSNNRTISGKVAAYYGSACVLESRISFVMYLHAAQIGQGAYAKVTYTDYLGKEQSVTVEGVTLSGYYRFDLDKIVVADSRCMLKWDFYNGNGELVVSVEDSLESYVARMAANDPGLEKILIFTDSARAYLQK